MKKLLRTRIHIGLEKPFKLLQITDVHIDDYDENDPEFQVTLTIKRRDTFIKEGNFAPLNPNQYLDEALTIAEMEQALPVITGDVYDLNTSGNRGSFRKIAEKHGFNFMYSPGGHEFQQICKRTAEEVPPYYENARKTVETAFPELHFDIDSRVVNGVNLITLDNDQDYFSPAVAAELKRQLAKGLPTIAFMHDPLNSNAIKRVSEVKYYVPRTPEEEKAHFEAVELLEKDPHMVAIFSGHAHLESERGQPGCTREYVTPGLYAGICRMIEID